MPRMKKPKKAVAKNLPPPPDFGPKTDLRVCLRNLMFGRPAGAQHFLDDCITSLDKCDGHPLPRGA